MTRRSGGVTISQNLLRRHAAIRLESARPDLAARLDLGTFDGLFEGFRIAAAGELATRSATVAEDLGTATVVLRDLELRTWVEGTCAFASSLDTATAVAWRRHLTKTVFLAGNPRNLRQRFPAARVAEDLTAAWFSPADPLASALRRLLPAFKASTSLSGPPSPPARLRLEMPPTRAPHQWEVSLATAGTALASNLITLNHLLVEAVLDGHLQDGDTVTVRPTPTLSGYRADVHRVRAIPDPDHAGRLRAEACLVLSPTSKGQS